MALLLGRVYRWLNRQRLDVLGAVVGLIMAVLLLPLQLVVTQVYVRSIPIVLGLASAVYLLAVRTERGAELSTMSGTFSRLTPSLVFLGLAAMNLVAVLQGERSLLFYHLAISVAAVVFLQILFASDDDFSPSLVLVQVLLLAIVVRFAALYTNPGFIGIDIWTHVAHWGIDIRQANSLAPIGNRKYYASPLFHLLVVAGADFIGTTLRTSLYLTLGVAMALSSLLIYATTRLLAPARWATLAAAIFAITGYSIEWGIHLIPTSLGLLFFLGLVYSMSRVLYTDYRHRDFVLVVLFSILIIFTHQVSAFIMLVFVGAGLAAQFLLAFDLFSSRVPEGYTQVQGRDAVNLTGLLTFDLGLITFTWSLTPYQGDTFLTTLINYLRSSLTDAALGSDVSSGTAGGGGEALIQTIITWVDASVLLILLFASIGGSLFVLRRRRLSHATLTAVVAIVVMLMFIFGLPLFGIETFLPGRWYAFVSVPMAVIGALGIGYFARELDPSLAVLVLFLFAVTFPAVSVLSSDATIDSRPFDSLRTRYSYTEQELAAVNTIGRSTDFGEDQRIYTDHPYTTVFERTEAYPTSPLVVQNGTVQSQEQAVYRVYQSTGGPFVSDGSGGALRPALSRQNVCGGKDFVYTNGQVTYCRTP